MTPAPDTTEHGRDRGGPYRDLLGRPHARALFYWPLLGRLPLGMAPVALLFLVRGQGESYGAAGVVVAAYSVAVGIGAPIAGRRVDRVGPARVLRMRALVYPSLVGVAAGLALVDAGIVPVAAAAAAAGLALPPISSSVRVVWPRVVPDELRSTAYALEAAVQELVFVGGPLLAAAIAAVEPAAAVAAAGLACLAGTLATARIPPLRDTPRSRAGGAGLLGALASPGIRTFALYAAVIGVAFGAVELAMPALAEEHGAREVGGVALACFAAGSLVGGLLAGMRPARDVRRRFHVATFLLAAAFLGLQLATSVPTLCALAFVAGLPIAPTVAAMYTLIDRVAREGTVAEAFAWFGTSISIGFAAGTALGGVVVDERGVRWSFAVGAAVALAGAIVARLRAGTLAPR